MTEDEATWTKLGLLLSAKRDLKVQSKPDLDETNRLVEILYLSLGGDVARCNFEGAVRAIQSRQSRPITPRERRLEDALTAISRESKLFTSARTTVLIIHGIAERALAEQPKEQE